ncbi:MAG: 30S ribosome-binding factor RbfA [Bacteroidetes bacterium]|nr:30S ribosome-binding factor RbfA [Bacteroidota bacterium]
MDSIRQQKVSKLLQKEMGDIFLREVRDINKGTLITVSKVRVSPDMQTARVYLSVFGGNITKEGIVEAVNQRKSEIRGLLGNRVGKQLRYVPGIEFFLDDSLDYIENIENLLKK